MNKGRTESHNQEARRDALLHKLLKTPPQPRPKRERDKKKLTRTRGKRASGEKP